MIRLFLIVAALVGLFSQIHAANPEALGEAYVTGNRAYANGEYTQAIEAYENALGHGQSANLHFNLANTFTELGEWGRAILHYRKALALEPQHTDARTNLRLTQREAKLEIDQPGFWVRWAENLPLSVWVVGASVAFWLLLAIWWLGGSRLPAPRLKALLTLGCLPVLLAAGPALYGYHLAGKTGVILGPGEITLRVAPTAQSPGSSSVLAGQSAHLRRITNGFYLVELPSGQEGYLAADEFAPVWDSAPHLETEPAEREDAVMRESVPKP